MKIRKAHAADIEAIIQMYEQARQFMKNTGNPDQWGSVHPPRSLTEQDLKRGILYVCTSETDESDLLAVFVLSGGADKTYAVIKDGKWLNDLPYYTVHRLAANGKTKGAASFCLNWAVLQHGNVRADTHENNAVMRHVLEKNGFAYCGRICAEDGSDRLAYQRTEKHGIS